MNINIQCLQEELRPNPGCAWLARTTDAEELTQPQRTKVAELLSAAADIRNGRAPQNGKAFLIQPTAKPQLAGAWINGSLHWDRRGKTVAVIAPTYGAFVQSALAWAAHNKTSKGAGPYFVPWEESETKAGEKLLGQISLQAMNDIPTITALVAATGDARATRDISDWMDVRRRTQAQTSFSRGEIERAMKQLFAHRRRAYRAGEHGWKGMTVYGAKNREFDKVIVLWPAAVRGSDDQKRRLLYNAVTRAKESCLVLVQAKAHLDTAPFT